MKLSVYKTLFREFIRSEQAPRPPVSESVQLQERVKKVGVVVFTDINTGSEREIDLCLDYNNTDSGYIDVDKNGKVYICFSKIYFATTGLNRIIATIAHEIGHYLSGHLEKDHSANFVFDNQNVGHNRQTKIERFLSSIEENETNEKYIKLFYRSVFSALLLGSCKEDEVQADLIAIQYVPVDDLILTHTEGLSHHNPFVRMEKQNRINMLSRLPVVEKQKLLKLSIVYTRPNKK